MNLIGSKFVCNENEEVNKEKERHQNDILLLE